MYFATNKHIILGSASPRRKERKIRKKKGEGREPDEHKRRTKGRKEARTPTLFKGFK